MKKRVISLSFLLYLIYKLLIMREKSLDFLGFPNYSVTDDGRVFSLNYNREGYKREMKPQKDINGYNRMELSIEGKRKKFKVHRLVSLAFIPNPDNLPEVNHKDECKTNNNVSNLEWCSKSYNINYGTRNERCGEKNLNRKDQSRPVKQFTKDGRFIAEYPSIAEVERQTGYINSYISSCCKGRRKSAYNYIWRYA